MATRVAVAMSGGVDSSVAAALLQREGHEVVGLFMRTGVERAAPDAHSPTCCSARDADDARRVAARLQVPFYVLDFSGYFQDVIAYFCDEYAHGRTPNPCVVCNERLKFGRLLRHAVDLDAGFLATGHYARVDSTGGRPRLLRGADADKDQSYFLCRLAPDQLSRVLFPLGTKRKAEVRDIARALDLPVAEKSESQEICFVPDGDYRNLLRERRPETVRKGPMKDTRGTLIGKHEGCSFFTIGQRRGLGVALGAPRYVVRIDPGQNEVIIGGREDLLRTHLIAADVNWASIPPPQAERRALVQIRYAHRAAAATLRPLPDGRVEVEFDRPQAAVTPGQAAVFYDDDLLLGGGWIE